MSEKRTLRQILGCSQISDGEKTCNDVCGTSPQCGEMKQVNEIAADIMACVPADEPHHTDENDQQNDFVNSRNYTLAEVRAKLKDYLEIK